MFAHLLSLYHFYTFITIHKITMFRFAKCVAPGSWLFLDGPSQSTPPVTRRAVLRRFQGGCPDHGQVVAGGEWRSLQAARPWWSSCQTMGTRPKINWDSTNLKELVVLIPSIIHTWCVSSSKRGGEPQSAIFFERDCPELSVNQDRFASMQARKPKGEGQ